MGSGGHALAIAPDCQLRGQLYTIVVQSHLLLFRKLGNFITPHLPVSFERDTNIRWWSLLSDGYARGSKRCHTGGRYVT